MLTKNITKQPKSVAEITITIPWSDIEGLWGQSVQRVSAELEIPGFRKGQAPVDMVEQRASNQIHDDFLKMIMPQALMSALQDTDVVPIDYPQYSDVNFTKGQDLSFKATVTMRPTVAIGDYKAVKAARPAVKTIEDQEIAKIIEDMYNRWKTRQPMADTANLEGQTPAVAPLDDNFAKAIGAANLADLQQKIRTDLENEAKYNNELDYEEAILQEVEKITTVDIPEILVTDELNRMLVSLQRNVADKGILLEEYLKSQNETTESIKEKWRPQAEKNVRMELGLSEIARLQNVSISDNELQAEIDKIQDARMKQQFENEEPRMHLRHALRQTKTLNMLKSLIPAS